MGECIKDCLSCSHSFSTEDDELFCVLHKFIVNENECCAEWN